MTATDTAQRRLLEALAALGKTDGGLQGLRLGIPTSIAVAETAGAPALAEVMRRFDDLAAAVQVDLRGAESG